MVRSFGQLEPDPEFGPGAGEQLEPIPDAAVAGRATLEVDVVLSPESLEAMEAQLTSLIARAVLAGFAAAAGQQQN